MVKYNNDILTKQKIARQFKYIMANKLTIYSVVDDTDHTKDAFQKSKLASQTLAGPVILSWMKQAFSKGFLLKIHLLCTYCLGPDWSSWIVLVKSKSSLRQEWPGWSVLTNGKCLKILLFLYICTRFVNMLRFSTQPLWTMATVWGKMMLCAS